MAPSGPACLSHPTLLSSSSFSSSSSSSCVFSSVFAEGLPVSRIAQEHSALGGVPPLINLLHCGRLGARGPLGAQHVLGAGPRASSSPELKPGTLQSWPAAIATAPQSVPSSPPHCFPSLSSSSSSSSPSSASSYSSSSSSSSALPVRPPHPPPSPVILRLKSPFDIENVHFTIHPFATCMITPPHNPTIEVAAPTRGSARRPWTST